METLYPGEFYAPAMRFVLRPVCMVAFWSTIIDQPALALFGSIHGSTIGTAFLLPHLHGQSVGEVHYEMLGTVRLYTFILAKKGSSSLVYCSPLTNGA